jgi:hypothetical protein
LGANGDFYLNVANDDYYFKSGGTWSVVANIKGSTGSTGSTGPPGADSTVPGPDGPQGDPGVNGSTWFTGSGAPGVGGVDGDYYFRTSNDDIYLKASGSWGVIANIKGTTGTAGSNGTNGTNGSTWFSGSGAPAGGTGVNGDYYLRTDTDAIYSKAAGSWSVLIASIKGDTGSTGSNGSTGPAPAGQLFLSAAGMWPSTTNGAVANTLDESVTNKQNIYYLDFVDGADNYCECTVVMPSDWDGSTITAKFYWTKAGTSTNSVVWGIAGRSYGDGETIDQALGSQVTVSDAGTATTLQVKISAATSAVTLSGTPAASELVQFKIQRIASNGSDTLAATARLMGVMINYGRV